MRLIDTVVALQDDLAAHRTQVIGLVPTMGALHHGHLSLIRRCRQDCDWVVVSLFVNPLQFSPQEDFDRYPRTLEADQQLCQSSGVDILFAPSVEQIYPHHADPHYIPTQIQPPAPLLDHLCAPSRPGHFQGVLTIVLKLLHLVQPQRVYLGQKDLQQLVLIQRMVSDLQVPCQIIPCATVREKDGLALSSRNRYLSEAERSEAVGLYQALLQGKDRMISGDLSATGILQAVHQELSRYPQLRPEYVELVDPEHLQPLTQLDPQIHPRGVLAIAATLGQTRLIDNVILEIPTRSSDPHPVQSDPSLPRRPLIAIDGPAGAGKSTVARRVAAELNLLYLDTGAMYRAITWLAQTKGVAPVEEEQITHLAMEAKIRLDTSAQGSGQTRVWVNGQEVTDAIRSQQVTQQVSQIAALAGVRQAMVTQQRSIGRSGGVVLDGRDIGTTVFPNAELKIFLTATPETRAERRQKDLIARGEFITLEDLERQIIARDRFDSERQIAPLRKAEDAIVIETDVLSQEDVQARIVYYYRRLLNEPLADPDRSKGIPDLDQPGSHLGRGV